MVQAGVLIRGVLQLLLSVAIVCGVILLSRLERNEKFDTIYRSEMRIFILDRLMYGHKNVILPVVYLTLFHQTPHD